MIILPGQPLSTNHVYKHTCRGNFPTMYMDKKGKLLKEQYAWEAKSQWKGAIIEEDLSVTIKLYFGDKRKRDVDNYNKLVLDALSGVVYKDDEQIQILVVSKHYDKENPRIEVAVHNLS